MNRASTFWLVSISVVFLGCKEPPSPKPVRPVRVIKVGDAESFTGRTLPGMASASEEVNLSFRVSGPLIELPVDVGTRVTASDVLGQIDPTDFRVAVDDSKGQLERAEQTLLGMRTSRPEDVRLAEETLNAALADLTNAEADFKRNEELIGSNAVSRSEFDRALAAFKVAQARVDSATEHLAKQKAGARPEDIAAKEAEIRSLRAAVEHAENQLAYTTLKAPFDGTIASTFVENYQTVQANQLIVRLVDTSSLEVAVSLPEQSIHLVKFVTDIECIFDAFPDKTFSATVKEVGTEASQTTRTYQVTLAVEQEYAAEGITVLPGMTCKVTGRVVLPDEAFARGAEVPTTSILEDGTGTYVWIVDEPANTVSRMPVTTGELTPYGIRVEGVEVGQLIVTAGVHYLEDGQEVRLQPYESE